MIPLSLVLCGAAAAWAAFEINEVSARWFAAATLARWAMDLCAWLWKQADQWTKGGAA